MRQLFQLWDTPNGALARCRKTYKISLSLLLTPHPVLQYVLSFPSSFLSFFIWSENIKKRKMFSPKIRRTLFFTVLLLWIPVHFIVKLIYRKIAGFWWRFERVAADRWFHCPACLSAAGETSRPELGLLPQVQQHYHTCGFGRRSTIRWENVRVWMYACGEDLWRHSLVRNRRVFVFEREPQLDDHLWVFPVSWGLFMGLQLRPNLDLLYVILFCSCFLVFVCALYIILCCSLCLVLFSECCTFLQCFFF